MRNSVRKKYNSLANFRTQILTELSEVVIRPMMVMNSLHHVLNCRFVFHSLNRTFSFLFGIIMSYPTSTMY